MLITVAGAQQVRLHDQRPLSSASSCQSSDGPLIAERRTRDVIRARITLRVSNRKFVLMMIDTVSGGSISS